MASNVTKRKRVVVTIDKKIEAIERYEKGEPMKTIAEEYVVGTSTVSDWCKNKDKLLEFSSKRLTTGSRCKPKVVSSCTYEEINETLFLWFLQQLDKGIPVTGPILKEKAAALAKLLGGNYKAFSASEGWLSKWKARYGVQRLATSGEKLWADVTSIASNDCKTDFKQLTENYCRDQIFNAVETGLNYRILPTQSLAAQKEKSPTGCEKCKERITVLMCCNASGECRLPLMIIGKSKNPRALKNVNSNALPVFYRHHKIAWMSAELFAEWFYEQFVPKVKAYLTTKGLPHKAILLIDNAPSHPDTDTLRHGEIFAHFFTPNVTSIVQPLNQGVVEAFKTNYRKMLLKFILGNDTSILIDNIKSISIKDAIFWSAMAWGSIKETALSRCWNKLMDENSENFEEASDEELVNMVRQLEDCEGMNEAEVREWITGDDRQDFTDQELVNAARLGSGGEESGAESDGGDEATVASEEGFKALDVALKFVEQHSSSTPADVTLIRQWRDLAAYECSVKRKKKQS